MQGTARSLLSSFSTYDAFLFSFWFFCFLYSKLALCMYVCMCIRMDLFLRSHHPLSATPFRLVCYDCSGAFPFAFAIFLFFYTDFIVLLASFSSYPTSFLYFLTHYLGVSAVVVVVRLLASVPVFSIALSIVKRGAQP